MLCPHCKSKNIKKNGTYKGKQKYKCNFCGKGFKEVAKEKQPYGASLTELLETGQKAKSKLLDLALQKEEKKAKVKKEQKKEEKHFDDYILRYKVNRKELSLDFMSEISDLNTRLDHADKVNFANIKFMQEVREENNNLYNRIARRNVVICLLITWLAVVVSRMLFY